MNPLMAGGEGGGPKLLVLGLSRKKSSYNMMELNLTEIIYLLMINNTFLSTYGLAKNSIC